MAPGLPGGALPAGGGQGRGSPRQAGGYVPPSTPLNQSATLGTNTLS
jgi:hypothetical protein